MVAIRILLKDRNEKCLNSVSLSKGGSQLCKTTICCLHFVLASRGCHQHPEEENAIPDYGKNAVCKKTGPKVELFHNIYDGKQYESVENGNEERLSHHSLPLLADKIEI